MKLMTSREPIPNIVITGTTDSVLSACHTRVKMSMTMSNCQTNVSGNMYDRVLLSVSAPVYVSKVQLFRKLQQQYTL